jgi:hypothetical protein
MRLHQSTASILILTVAVSFCCPIATWAQSAGASQTAASPSQAAPQPAQDNAPASQQDRQQATPADSQVNGAKVDPSQPPLQPVTTYPDAAGNPQKEMDGGAQQPSRQSQIQTPPSEPQGAATAEKVPTAGGAAAKPAGAAIAPAKQRQARSLLIKLGAVAAGAVAAGTIYGLSKGTPSTPPGSNSPGAVQKR